VRIPWRRHDSSPEKKEVVICSAASGATVKNRVVIAINREFGDLVFQPETGRASITSTTCRSPRTRRCRTTARIMPRRRPPPSRPGWRGMDLRPSGSAGPLRLLPKALVLEFQNWSEFHRFDPMEVIAQPPRKRRTDRPARGADRTSCSRGPVAADRMSDDLPLCWNPPGPSL